MNSADAAFAKPSFNQFVAQNRSHALCERIFRYQSAHFKAKHEIQTTLEHSASKHKNPQISLLASRKWVMGVKYRICCVSRFATPYIKTTEHISIILLYMLIRRIVI